MNLNTCNTYIVYKHTAPNGKIYIGITKHDPKFRWLNNGRGYKHQTVLFNAIIKYGWINFQHEILFKNLTEEEALDKEEELIKMYLSYDRRYGYNVSLRGGLYNEEWRNGGNKNKRRKPLHIPKYSGNGKEVIKCDYNDNILETFISVAQAARFINLPIETVRTRLNRDKTINYEHFYLQYNPAKPPQIQMLSLQDEPIYIFKNVAEAYKFLNVKNKGHIHRCCMGLSDSYKHYKWRFYYEN